MPVTRLALAAVSALALSACAAHRPSDLASVSASVPAAARAPFLSAQGDAVAPTPLPPQWWRLYDDPVLDALIADAMRANSDVRVAVARIERARAAVRGARAERLPQGGLSASGGYALTPDAQTPPGADRSGAAFGLGASVAYEVDLFGRVAGSVAAARGDLAAARADADAVRVMVVADTADSYAVAAGAAARIATAQSIVALLDESLRLTRRRHAAGLSDGLAVARIEALREQRAAAIPALEAERAAALFALATLTGRAPADLPPVAGERALPPMIAAPIPVGDGAALLARRPDVRAAEERLRADTARIGVARADLYPRITLGGSLSAQGASLGSLFSGGALGLVLGPLIEWAFPNREPVRARIDAAGADAAASLAAFDGTVLRAVQETETALSAYARALEQRRALAAAEAAAARAARITRAQNREGVVDSLQSLDAERTLAEARAALADQDAALSRRQIALFRALGGGWNADAAGGAA